MGCIGSYTLLGAHVHFDALQLFHCLYVGLDGQVNSLFFNGTLFQFGFDFRFPYCLYQPSTFEEFRFPQFPLNE